VQSLPQPTRPVDAARAGLEFDHVVLTDLSEVDDQFNLYVALTRARKTIRLFGLVHRHH